MGLAAVAALLAIALSFLAQSPRMLARLHLTGSRLDLRARTLTGYGLALLLLAMGFFAAGVPLGGPGAAAIEPTAAAALAEATPATTAAETLPATGSQSGAMVGLPTSSAAGEDANGVGGGLPTADLSAVAPITATVAAGPSPTVTTAPGTPTPEATPTLFPTATPTPTPSPTPSPTPILVPTAVVGENTSTLPVRQLPGGPVLVVLVRGDIVLPRPGHAFQGGDLWREISTVNGVIGWVPDEFLDYGEAAD